MRINCEPAINHALEESCKRTRLMEGPRVTQPLVGTAELDFDQWGTQMTNLLRTTAAVAALTFAATPALAAPVQPDKQASATARIVKPLTLTWEQDLDFGTITLVDSGPTTVAVAQDGTRSCPGTAVTCSGTSQAARYRITGVNNQNVTVTAGNVSLVHSTDNTKTLLMTTDAPASVNLGNSGAAGTPLNIGGSISVAGTTADGTYIGTFAVTVNY